MQQIAVGQRHAFEESRPCAAAGHVYVDVLDGGQPLQVEVVVHHRERGCELGNRGDRPRKIGPATPQLAPGFEIDDQGAEGLHVGLSPLGGGDVPFGMMVAWPPALASGLPAPTRERTLGCAVSSVGPSPPELTRILWLSLRLPLLLCR